jgi:hypothetical protein
MVKSLIYGCMAALLVLNGMVYSVIQGSYVLNKAAIIENFCVNKSQPELKCDGKCYLAQQLKAEKEKQDQNSQHSFAMDFGQFVVAEQILLLVVDPINNEASFSQLYLEVTPNIFSGDIDTPPRI